MAKLLTLLVLGALAVGALWLVITLVGALISGVLSLTASDHPGGVGRLEGVRGGAPAAAAERGRPALAGAGRLSPK